MKTIPSLQPGDKIWRPVIPHLLYGLQPVDLDLAIQIRPVDDVIREDPLRGYAVWGDTDEIGAPPADWGWRLSDNPRTGTPLLSLGSIPVTWTHFVVNRLAMRRVGDRRRTCVWCSPKTDGRDELHKNAERWFEGAAAKAMSANEAEAYRVRIFDRELWDLNWARYQKDPEPRPDPA